MSTSIEVVPVVPARVKKALDASLKTGRAADEAYAKARAANKTYQQDSVTLGNALDAWRKSSGLTMRKINQTIYLVYKIDADTPAGRAMRKRLSRAWSKVNPKATLEIPRGAERAVTACIKTIKGMVDGDEDAAKRIIRAILKDAE